MNYQDFLEHVKEYFINHLTNGQTVVIQSVPKNNGIVYDGIVITDPTLNISPTIYLHPFYKHYCTSQLPLSTICEAIFKAYENNLPTQNFDISNFTDFSKAKQNIVMKLVNYEKNKTLLEDVPHIHYLDLAIVFLCIVKDFKYSFCPGCDHGVAIRLIAELLDELNLNNKLHLDSCSELFEDKDHLLHTTSIIPYPVFINNKNYTGSNPKIMDNKVLYSFVKKYFYNEMKKLSEALIIPLGKAVEEVLEQMIKENLIKEEQCLLGFPHPSGANGHRKNQFKENKEKLYRIIEDYFKTIK